MGHEAAEGHSMQDGSEWEGQRISKRQSSRGSRVRLQVIQGQQENRADVGFVCHKGYWRTLPAMEGEILWVPQEHVSVKLY